MIVPSAPKSRLRLSNDRLSESVRPPVRWISRWKVASPPQPMPKPSICDSEKIAAERAECGRDHAFDAAHLAVLVALRIGAERERVGDAAAVKAGEGEVVGIIGSTVAERRQHAGIDSEFASARGELGLVEEDVEAEQLAAAGIVENRGGCRWRPA